MREERFFTAEETVTNERIDKFLSTQIPDRSRSYIQKLIKDGLVEVNGKQPQAVKTKTGQEVLQTELQYRPCQTTSLHPASFLSSGI